MLAGHDGAHRVPYGKDWHCIVCWKVYPEKTPLRVCLEDGGHLHRIYAAELGPDETWSVSETDKRRAMLDLHEQEN